MERFWSKVDKTQECWNWVAAKDRSGYGQFKLRGTMKRAHRVSWELRYGMWPTMYLLHSCDNPSCVNPDHLSEGTQKDNVADMIRKGRRVVVRLPGEKNGLSKLTLDQVKEIRSNYIPRVVTQKKLAEKYSISSQQISKIIKGDRWGEFGDI